MNNLTKYLTMGALSLTPFIAYSQEPYVPNALIDIPNINADRGYQNKRELILVASNGLGASHAIDYDINGDRLYDYRIQRITGNRQFGTGLIVFLLDGAQRMCSANIDLASPNLETDLNCETGEIIRRLDHPQTQPTPPSGEEL